ncbi:alpha-tocopherol transfer protein-like [Anabrus simplex]|uniref:alpha-tocopherol transfer protein-like n=1 Tax=Anabrus simplex TaxID=316456 RepID=UPI0035A2914A
MLDDDVSMTLDLGEPPQEVLDYAREHIGESPDTRLRLLQDLRDMVYERGEVQPHRMDDSFLLRFLRARHFVVERAHRLLVNYYNFKENNPDLHKNINPLSLRYISEDDVVLVLPYREQTGRRVLIYRMGNWNPRNYSVEEIFKATVIVLELAILEQRAQVLGGVCIFDLGGLSLQHAWSMTPQVANRVVQLMGGSFPIRTHAIHIVNQSWVFDIVFALFKPLLDERMRERIYFHGNDWESLHQHINPKFLPERYGGTRPEYNYTEWMDSLQAIPKIREEIRSLGYIVDDDATSEETR